MKHSIWSPSRQIVVALFAGVIWLNGVAGPGAAWAQPVKGSVSAHFETDDADDTLPETPSIQELPLAIWDLESAGDVQLAIFDFEANPREASIAASIQLKTGLERYHHPEADSELPTLARVAVELQS